MGLREQIHADFSIPSGFMTRADLVRLAGVTDFLFDEWLGAAGISITKQEIVIDAARGAILEVYSEADIITNTSATAEDIASSKQLRRAVYLVGGGGGLADGPVGDTAGIIPMFSVGVGHEWFSVEPATGQSDPQGTVIYSGPDANFLIFSSFNGNATTTTRSTVRTGISINDGTVFTPSERDSYHRTTQGSATGGSSCGVSRRPLASGDTITMKSLKMETNHAVDYEINRCSLTLIQV